MIQGISDLWRRGKIYKYLLVIAIYGALLGCSIPIAATDQELALIEKSRVFNKGYDSVWSAVVKTISTKGYMIQNQDKSSGSLSTDFFVTTEAIALIAGHRHKVNIFVEKKNNMQTQVTITPVFEVKNTDIAPWRPFVARQANTITFEKELLDTIQKNLEN